jgi:hypothetical protein
LTTGWCALHAHGVLAVRTAAERDLCGLFQDELTGKKERKEVEQQPADPIAKMLQITCARCHKLAYEGRVASPKAEAQLPAFDLGATVGAKIARRTARRAVVAVVVDIADFDGSLPRCESCCVHACCARMLCLRQ